MDAAEVKTVVTSTAASTIAEESIEALDIAYPAGSSPLRC